MLSVPSLKKTYFEPVVLVRKLSPWPTSIKHELDRECRGNSI